jgi:formylglycine-generating enzyme required for sulfatase activity
MGIRGRIPPGEFLMGSTPDEIEAALQVNEWELWQERVNSEGPQHKVILTQPLYVGVTEVTQAQYEQVMGTEPGKFNPNVRQNENHPVASVNWTDATEFCRRLTERKRGAGLIAEAWEYRLPTEAEWEFAGRAGAESTYS